ncbi:MAG: YdcF family protein [Vicinamibacterales bacterium]
MAALLGALWVLGAPVAARLLIVRSEPSRADAVIVLSGSAVYAERIRHASQIYLQGRARAILLTDDGLAGGWSREQQRNPRSIERGRDMLLTFGVPSDDVIMLPVRVHSTYDEALAARTYARAHGHRSLLIVTSPYHSRRALWVFNRVLAADAVSVGMDPVPPGDQSPSPGMWWLSRGGWQSVAAEYPKFLYYAVAYR